MSGTQNNATFGDYRDDGVEEDDYVMISVVKVHVWL